MRREKSVFIPLFWGKTVRLNGTVPQVLKCASTVDQFKQKKKKLCLPNAIADVYFKC